MFPSTNKNKNKFRFLEFDEFDSSKIMSKENGAISLLCKAVELDTKKQYTRAIVCYTEGLQMLMDVIKGMLDSKIP